MAKGLLVAAFDFSTAHADEFHDWYDLEHIPERRAVPGFGTCERWIGEEERTFSVATYDLNSIDVLRGEAYASIAYGNLSVWSKRVTAMCKRLLRFEGTQITPGEAAAPNGAGGLLLNAMNVAPEVEKDFNAWYDRYFGCPALPVWGGHGRHASLRCDLSPQIARRDSEQSLDGRRRYAVERPIASTFPRSNSHPDSALCSS